ncbi:unnamed protein product [Diatraea saccharalis]|uniref:Uncharacterized protein n=1 Tax=Diatraea saccharalis TaxID=40085 RepID=A0A9N9QXK8_9NEOP|nr:unnamed protein product [Diatraea saccharalis]
MFARLALLLLVLQCFEICVPIRVPTVWNGDNSEVKPEEDKFSVEQFKPQVVQQQPIPIQYFEYTAKKPQFAVDIANFHGVQSPETLFKAHPVKPFTGRNKPELGKHRIQDENRPVFQQFQKYIKQNDNLASYVTPSSTNYDIFHPYKAEEPRLQDIYKDPILDKIRNDIQVSSQRFEKQESDSGNADISKDEYLESPEQTDLRKLPQKNIPVSYEIHRPQRRPVYYSPIAKHPNRDHILNQRFKHPWNQNYVKIRPLHYQPLKHHLQRLRQHHALTYNDERNEYPQVPILQPYEEPSNGYDIYVKGKEKYLNLRNNLDESINNLVLKNRPIISQKLELQKDEKSPDEEEEEEFVPIKNYAQVRKTETTKHLPKEAAFDDAESYEEIKNAPRLREAIKSTKAQTVYTEEGYEDSAYDHAGEQKHASDHEAHGGFLKENERSGGKYKAPSLSASYKDDGGSAFKEQVLDGKIWKENNKNSKHQEDSEDYSGDEYEHSIEADNYKRVPTNKEDNQRNKRHNKNEVQQNGTVTTTKNITNEIKQHDVNKRETDFKVPDVDIDSTLLTEKDILKIAMEKIVAPDLSEKYPYYFKDSKLVNKNSPIRYAENFKLIPQKTLGGTEFYDSRSLLECPEVDEKVDALPEKFKKKGHPDEPEDGSITENNEKGESTESLPRLEGLGDKIDCFKAKYFGHNPLDSPFFNEEIISEPEPVLLPNLSSFKLKHSKNNTLLETAPNNVVSKLENPKKAMDEDIYQLLKKLQNKNNKLKESLIIDQQGIATKLNNNKIHFTNLSEMRPNNDSNGNLQSSISESNVVYNSNIKNITSNNGENNNSSQSFGTVNLDDTVQTKKHIDNTTTTVLRNKRAAPFVYEPYKIIRDVQTSDSKKTTTTGNISPLIKQLQSSKVIDTVVKSNNDKDQPLKVSLGSRAYKDIGKKEREHLLSNNSNDSLDPSIVDVSVDKRRGEPRYEFRPSNHKSDYSPVQNKKAMSVEDYENHTKLSNKNNTVSSSNNKRPSARNLFNIANNFRKSEDFQNSAASSNVRQTVTSAPQTVKKEPSSEEKKDVSESEEDYEDEYEDEEEEEVISTTTTTTTTTTIKPIFRKRMRTATTTKIPEIEVTEEPPKLRLVTRFRNSSPITRNTNDDEKSTAKISKKLDDNDDISLPKYREKKKMSTKSTLVTDTKKYGDEDDDMRKEEIDALIGVKHDMDDYVPLYEKEAKKKNQESVDSDEDEENEDSEETSSEEDEDEEDEDIDEEDDDEENEEELDEKNPKIFTTETPRRTLVRTTEPPISTTEAKSAKLESKPIISRKKVAIHKELPVDKTAPHVTEFKQDIEEVEIIKEIPRKAIEKKTNKNLEALDLYKDDNLATDINKLGAVEIFDRNLDLKNGPKHGGNYRHAPALEKKALVESSNTDPKVPKDAETSQTENKKLIELDDSGSSRKMHGGNLKPSNDAKRSRGEKKFEKYIELTEKPDTGSLHGGNLRSINDRKTRRGGNRSEKLIELGDDHDDQDDDSANRMHGGNFKPYSSSNNRNSGRGLHGGNYRSSRLVQAEDTNDDSEKRLEKAKTESTKKINSADLLNSFARAVPILTTTPSYILDPSKRMYYYVDA